VLRGKTDNDRALLPAQISLRLRLDAVITKQVEIALKLDGFVFRRHAAADAIAQHGEILRDEERGETEGRQKAFLISSRW